MPFPSIILDRFDKTICSKAQAHQSKSKMKTTSILAAIVGVLSCGIQSVEAKCFGDGASWANKEVSNPRMNPIIVSEISC
jgi:hypothetical protein